MSTIKIGQWDFSWCFLCQGATAHCPKGGCNSCACGCAKQRQNDCTDWWQSQNGEEFENATRRYFRPSRDEVLWQVKYLPTLPQEAKAQDVWGCDLLDVMDHARWHGLDVEMTMKCWSEDNPTWRWDIKLLSEPTGTPREHVKACEENV